MGFSAAVSSYRFEEDYVGIGRGPRDRQVRDIEVAGQSLEQRRRMANPLKGYGFMDGDEYPTTEAFMSTLVQL